MARSGDVIENPVTGQRVRFMLTGAETGGRLFRAEAAFPPGGSAGPRHVHPRQREDFEVLSGRAVFTVGGREQSARAGERVEVPAGTAHTFRTAGEEELRLLIELRPAPPSTARFFELYLGLGQEGRMSRRGMPDPLDMALIWPLVSEHVVLPLPPAPVQAAVFRALRPLARLRGRRLPVCRTSGTRSAPDGPTAST